MLLLASLSLPGTEKESLGNMQVFSRLEEKGYFEYGGSTIVMFFQPNIMIDEDILRQSQAGYETQVFIGDKIGQRKE